jgi:hypothetical protein
MKIPNLPQDLTQITATQYRAAVCYLSRKPLSELRRHQLLIRKQEKRAHKQKNRSALDNLYVMERIAADAVFEHEFGPSICLRPKR